MPETDRAGRARRGGRLGFQIAEVENALGYPLGQFRPNPRPWHVIGDTPHVYLFIYIRTRNGAVVCVQSTGGDEMR